MKNNIIRICIYSFTIMFITLFVNNDCYSQNNKKPDKRKLLIIATLNNLYYNIIKDTSFNFDSCIYLKIDTILLSQRKKIAEDINIEKRFEYKNNWFDHTQLIDIKKNINIKKYHIKSFCILSTFIRGDLIPLNYDPCFENQAKETLKYFIKVFYESKSRIKGKIFLSNIKVESDDGESFEVNDIQIDIIK